MNYTTIKIPAETHRLIKKLAIKTSMAQQDVLAKCLKIFEEQIFWEQCKIAYEDLSNNEIDNLEEINESKLLENTLMDGLDDEY
jgi:hypothetical protein